jgi:hypothetical protein
VAKQQLAQAETEVMQCNMQLEHSKKELRTKEPKLKQTEMLFAKDKSELQLKEREVVELKVILYLNNLLISTHVFHACCHYLEIYHILHGR